MLYYLILLVILFIYIIIKNNYSNMDFVWQITNHRTYYRSGNKDEGDKGFFRHLENSDN